MKPNGGMIGAVAMIGKVETSDPARMLATGMPIKRLLVGIFPIRRRGNLSIILLQEQQDREAERASLAARQLQNQSALGALVEQPLFYPGFGV